jgi:uncharacterized spore protein YtfJ
VEFGEFVGTIRDTLSARRVFGEPVEHDGVVVIPAAVVMGGGGGGTGTAQGGPQQGGGLGLLAWPVGAFVISNGTVRWKPAVDVNGLSAIAGLVIGAVLIAHRPRRRRHSVGAPRRHRRLS